MTNKTTNTTIFGNGALALFHLFPFLLWLAFGRAVCPLNGGAFGLSCFAVAGVFYASFLIFSMRRDVKIARRDFSSMMRDVEIARRDFSRLGLPPADDDGWSISPAGHEHGPILIKSDQHGFKDSLFVDGSEILLANASTYNQLRVFKLALTEAMREKKSKGGIEKLSQYAASRSLPSVYRGSELLTRRKP